MTNETNEIENTEETTSQVHANGRRKRTQWRHLFKTAFALTWTSLKWATINQRTVNGAYVNNLSVILNRQQRSYFSKGIRIEVTKEEFYQFCADNESKIWEIMNRGEKPSIDRIDDDKHYSLDNMQIISLSENRSKSRPRTKDYQKKSKIRATLDNRRAYLEYHPSVETKLMVDDYLRLTLVDSSVNVGIIEKLISIGLITAPFTTVPAESNTITAEASEFIRSYNDLKTEEAQIKLQQIEETQAELSAKKAAILQLKNEEAKRKAIKAWVKSHPEYNDLMIEMYEYRPALMAANTTPQKEVIKLLTAKYPDEVAKLKF